MSSVNGALYKEAVQDEIRNSIVYTRNGKTITRVKGEYTDSRTPEQMVVRSLFSSLVQDWKRLPDFVKSGWSSVSKRKKMSGFNLFIRENFERVREHNPMKICRSNYQEWITQINTGSEQAEEISISWKVTKPETNLIVALRKQSAANEAEKFLQYFSFAQDQQPAIISNLQSGVTYELYAWPANGPLETATLAGDSIHSQVTVL